eukprot:TRINITY_DN8664_c0_g1_i1.p1 TRINITY_DN8664_c0_g1~~TRINITY_DN8664_c0_g1_i1.p1  ORF type:complete len:252 (-),score=47.10 TRINITY_DN8664_c0_g1_i1:27-782(-)
MSWDHIGQDSREIIFRNLFEHEGDFEENLVFGLFFDEEEIKSFEMKTKEIERSLRSIRLVCKDWKRLGESIFPFNKCEHPLKRAIRKSSLPSLIFLVSLPSLSHNGEEIIWCLKEANWKTEVFLLEQLIERSNIQSIPINALTPLVEQGLSHGPVVESQDLGVDGISVEIEKEEQSRKDQLYQKIFQYLLPITLGPRDTIYHLLTRLNRPKPIVLEIFRWILQDPETNKDFWSVRFFESWTVNYHSWNREL